MSNETLIIQIEELKELKNMMDELKAEIDCIESTLKKALEERGVEELEVGTYVIRHTTVLSNRFDTTAFKKVHAELYKAYTKQTVSKRFSVK